MAGEPLMSASVTAEAGKLPTLNVRPFWPFQVVELGLWEEALVKGMRASGGRAPAAFRSQVVCHGATSVWRKENLFLPNTKGLYGLWWLHQGGQDYSGLRRSQGSVGRGGNEVDDQGSRSWGEAGKGPGSGRLGGSLPGDI